MGTLLPGLPRMLRRASALLLVAIVAWLPLACGPEDPLAPALPGGPVAYDADGRSLRPVARPARRPNLIVILIDTLRADALSLDASGRGVMPELSARAARATAFENAVAPASWTMPSVASLLTGLLPGEHLQSSAVVPPPSTAALTYLPEILAATYGYDTAAFVGLPSNEGPRAMFSGFDKLELGFQLQAAPERLPGWANARNKDQPFFLLLHTYEAHDPYGAANHPNPPLRGAQISPEELAQLGQDPDPAYLTRRLLTDGRFKNALRDRAPGRRDYWMPKVVGFMYDGLRREPDPNLGPELHAAYRAGVSWVDGLLARTLTQLEGLGLTKDALLVISSDHGEAFGEHGELQHQRWLYDELLRIPLVIQGPAPFDRPRRVRAQVAFHDVLPTFFDWAGFALPAGLDGRSFLSELDADGPGRNVLSEEVRPPQMTEGRSHAALVSARSLAWKYILTHETKDDSVLEELYDLGQDPAEQKNLLLVATTPVTLPADFVSVVEQARDRIYDPARRILPSTAPPATPRPAPFTASTLAR